jgi:hypothetical protein
MQASKRAFPPPEVFFSAVRDLYCVCCAVLLVPDFKNRITSGIKVAGEEVSDSSSQTQGQPRPVS